MRRAMSRARKVMATPAAMPPMAPRERWWDEDEDEDVEEVWFAAALVLVLVVDVECFVEEEVDREVVESEEDEVRLVVVADMVEVPKS